MAAGKKSKDTKENSKQTTKEIRTPWEWTFLTDFGESANTRPPLFSKDGSYFFTIFNTSIRIYSVSTGQLVSTLSSPHSRDEIADQITSAILNPQNAFQLITGSLDGHIRIWDFLEGILLQTINISQPIFYICAHETIRDAIFTAAARPGKKFKKGDKPSGDDESCAVLKISLKVKQPALDEGVYLPSQIVPVGKTRSVTGLAVSATGTYLIAVAGHKAYVALTSALKSGFTKYVSPENLTCLAVHPSDDYFATGDEKGVVRLWYCLNQSQPKVVGAEKRAQTSTLHWHAHAVSSVAFTPNGAYLLSGGEEAVLVIWQLHSGKKEFVPRVGSPIKSIAVSRASSSEEYLLGLADTSFAFVSAATLKLSRVFAKVKIDPAVKQSISTRTVPLAVHTPSETLILPSSHPSSLQTYSPSSAALVAELEVSPSNRVARRDEKILEPSRVERAVVSSSGDWMATIDRREGDDAFRGEIYLKFWWWNRKAGSWTLNTRIDRPHGLTNVTSSAFNNATGGQSLQLATTGEDGNIKTWRIRTTKDKKGSVEVSWTARSSLNYRSEQPKHVTWSPDGSVLAVTLGSSVVLYESYSNIQRHVFVAPECDENYSAQLIGVSGRYLAVVGSTDLVLWNVLDHTVQWHYQSPQPISHIIPHPYHNTFAVISPKANDAHSRVCLFATSSKATVQDIELPFDLLNVAWYPTPLPSPMSPLFSLVAITSSFNLVLLCEDARLLQEKEEGLSTVALNKNLAGTQKRSLFQEMFGITDFSQVSKPSTSEASNKIDTSVPWKSSATSSVFSSPAYLMPPMHTLFEPLIDSFLKLRTDDDPEGEQNEFPLQQNGDVDMNGVSDGEMESSVLTTGNDTNREELSTYVALFKGIANAPDYPYQASKPQQSQKKPITSTPRRAKSPSTPVPPKTPNPAPPTPPQVLTPSLPAKAGKKRSRHSLG